MHSPKHKVVAVAFDHLTFFEMGIAVEVFGLPRPECNPGYQFSVCAADPGWLRTHGGLRIKTPRRGLRLLAEADTIIVPGWRDILERPPEKLLRALQRASDRGTRIASFCSGAFVLAAAGLLDGREATTHWRFTEQLVRMYPEVRVNADVLYVEDGNILTAAGSAAAIDLCLHMVRSDFGTDTANLVARRLVVQPHREGGQAQFIAQPVVECPDHGLAGLLDWLVAHVDENHSVETMAARVHMSPRTFARRFRDQTGTTPARWLSRERVRQAQHLLESTDLGIDQVAARCGFGSAQLLRFHFHRAVGSTPTAYRRAFAGTATGTAPTL